MADAVVHPIDTTRVRLQLESSKISQSASRTFLNIIQSEGVKALYKGFSAVAAGTIPGHALYFYGYEKSKKVLQDHLQIKPEKKFIIHFISGIIADVYGSLSWTPMDVIKQRLQAQIKGQEGINRVRYSGSMDAVKTILKEDGFKGLFKGYWTGIAVYGPFCAFYFTIYEEMKRLLQIYFQREQLPFLTYLVASGIAGSFSAAITCPLDVIKTRVQVNSGTTNYRNAFQVFNDIRKNEGTKSFFKGWKPRCLWVGGGTATTMFFCKI